MRVVGCPCTDFVCCGGLGRGACVVVRVSRTLEMLPKADIYFALAGPLEAILMVAYILVLNLRSCV